MNPQLASQINSLLAALILLTAFALVVQRRMNALLHLFAWQGFLLAVSTAIVGYMGGAHDLYISSILTRSTLAVALATVMLGFLMMITRKHAGTQIIGFLAMENGLLFAATSATYGMPLVVELGVALDLLIAAFIFGMFFFHISTTFDSLDVDQMARLKEED